jgi:predicted adenine nucleotide alpha hydrolase (AANH) superfamily ATPase
MNNINYATEMQKIINHLDGKKPTLLLHSCCAPCSSACIEQLKDFFDITVYYFNPNIDTSSEYQVRSNEQVKFCQNFGIKTIVVPYCSDDFYSAVTGFENEREGGKRCEICYRIRLIKTALYAKDNGFEYFATTLTVSPLKNAQLLNQLGLTIASEYGVKYLPSDFKKNNGYLRSITLSKEYGLYRQNYCGCKFSKTRA